MDPNDEYTLTEADAGLLAPINEQIQALNGEATIILRSILRREKLTGENWRLEGDKLKRA